jgi:small subunit ribosomal protein S16
MATRIRLSRVGRKKQATFRIVVAGSMHARGGRVTETIGKYNPRTYPSYIEIDEVRALYWLKQGAQVSDSVVSLFRKAGIMKKYADGVDGEGIVKLGEGGGKTILAERPKTESKKAKAKAAAPAAEAAAEAPAAEAPAAEATPAVEAAPVAEAEAVEAEAVEAEAVKAEAEAEGEGTEAEAEKEKQGDE